MPLYTENPDSRHLSRTLKLHPVFQENQLFQCFRFRLETMRNTLNWFSANYFMINHYLMLTRWTQNAFVFWKRTIGFVLQFLLVITTVPLDNQFRQSGSRVKHAPCKGRKRICFILEKGRGPEVIKCEPQTKVIIDWFHILCSSANLFCVNFSCHIG